MCGILGYCQQSGAKKHLTRLLLESQARGSDATGLAYIVDEMLYHVKGAIPSSKFVCGQVYADFMTKRDPKILIGHTRAKTQGDASNNLNNHPLIDKKRGLALVHNGMINNDDSVFEDFKLDREAEVDSEVILKLIGHFMDKGCNTENAIIKTIAELRGSLAIALINLREPDRLYLAKTANPIYLAFQKTTGNIFFASNDDYIKEATSTKTLIAGFFDDTIEDDLLIKKVPDDTGLIIENGAIIKTFQVSDKPWQSTVDHTKKLPANSSTEPAYCAGWKVAKYKSKKKHITKPSYPLSKFFNPMHPITKPSQYATDDLFQRYDIVDAQIERLDPVVDWEMYSKLDQEKRRLENTIYGREAAIVATLE